MAQHVRRLEAIIYASARNSIQELTVKHVKTLECI
jgi:hypothetical protein